MRRTEDTRREKQRAEKLREKIWMKTTIKFDSLFKKWLWFAWDIRQNTIGEGNGVSIRACSLQVEELRKRVVHAAKNEIGEQKP